MERAKVSILQFCTIDESPETIHYMLAGGLFVQKAWFV